MASGIKRVSLVGETLSEIKNHIGQLYLWIVLFGLFIALVQIVLALVLQQPDNDIAKQLQHNPQLFKQHPELATQYMQSMKGAIFPFIIGFLGMLAAQAVAYYVFIVSYLRLSMPQAAPSMSVNGFFYWFGKVLWKYLRPILWCLIPIIGAFIYLRSLVRYAVVSPLAVLRQGTELQTSWNLTENNWWRIFFNQLGVSLVMLLVMLVVLLVPAAIVGIAVFALHAGTSAPWVRGCLALYQGFVSSGAIMTGAIFCSVLYRTLLDERGDASTPR